MKRSLLSLGSILIGAALIFSSCTKSNSTGSGKISYQVKPTNFTSSIGSSISGSGLTVNVNSASSLTWNSGHITLSEINFEAEQDTSEIEYEFKNVSNVDLFNLSPVLGSINVPKGTYKEVELKVKLDSSGTSTPALSLKGTYIDENSHSIPVEFYFNEDMEMEAKAKDFLVDGTKDYLGLINIQLNKILADVNSSDMNGATQTNGVIIISSSSNVELYNKIKGGIAAWADTEFED